VKIHGLHGGDKDVRSLLLIVTVECIEVPWNWRHPQMRCQSGLGCIVGLTKSPLILDHASATDRVFFPGFNAGPRPCRTNIFSHPTSGA